MSSDVEKVKLTPILPTSTSPAPSYPCRRHISCGFSANSESELLEHTTTAHSLNPEQIVYKVKDRLRQSAISQTLFSECVLGISSAATVCDLFASPPKSWRCESLLRMQRFLNDPNAMQKLIDKQHALNRRIRNKKRPIDDSISETLPRSKKMGPFYCPYGAECKVKHEFVTWNGLCAHIRHFHPSRQGSCPITGLVKDDADGAQQSSETKTKTPTAAVATSSIAKTEPSEEEVLTERLDSPVACPHGAYCSVGSDVKFNSNAELFDHMQLIHKEEDSAIGRIGSTNWRPGQPLTVCVFCSTERRSCEYQNPEALANHLRRFHAAATSFELCANSKMYKFFICPNMDCIEPFHPSQTRLNFHKKTHARAKTPPGTEPEVVVEVDYSQVAASAKLLSSECWQNTSDFAYSGTSADDSMIPLIPSAADSCTVPIMEIRERWNTILREKISPPVMLNAKRSSVSDMNSADGGTDSILATVKCETDAL